MKRFKFRLQKVLEYRQLVKKEKWRVLAECNAKVNEIENNQERIKRELVREHVASGTHDATSHQLTAMYRKRLESELVELGLQLVDAKEKQAEALAAYQEAAKEEEALVKLRERKEAEYNEYVEQEEMKFLDELAVMKGNTLFGE